MIIDGKSIWALHDAVKKVCKQCLTDNLVNCSVFTQDDSSLVSVFAFDGSSPSSRDRLPLAKNALKKLKTIRHPNIITYVDSFETETSVYIVTERVKPLSVANKDEVFENQEQREQWNMWGLERIVVSC